MQAIGTEELKKSLETTNNVIDSLLQRMDNDTFKPAPAAILLGDCFDRIVDSLEVMLELPSSKQEEDPFDGIPSASPMN